MTQKQLIRSTVDRKIAGVCAGLAEYLGFDVTLVRVAFAVSVLFGGFGVLVYVVLWIAVPEGPGTPPALNVAQERYARGEIDAEEYQRIRRDLGGGGNNQ